jgi:hypothetical protein
MMNIASRSISYFEGFFNMPQELMTWGLQFPSKESILQISIALKIHHPQLGFNPQTMGLMASTLTARPHCHSCSMGI